MTEEEVGQIPQSDLLLETGTGVEAIRELNRRAGEILSQDPEKVDLKEMIQIYRLQRQKWDELEAAGGGRVRVAKAPGVKATHVKAEDIF